MWVKISDLRRNFKCFLEDRFYPDVEVYGWKKKNGNKIYNRYNSQRVARRRAFISYNIFSETVLIKVKLVSKMLKKLKSIETELSSSH